MISCSEVNSYFQWPYHTAPMPPRKTRASRWTRFQGWSPWRLSLSRTSAAKPERLPRLLADTDVVASPKERYLPESLRAPGVSCYRQRPHAWHVSPNREGARCSAL